MGYKYSFDPDSLAPENLTRETAYLLGAMFSDGAISPQGFRITSIDREWLTSLPVLCGFTAPIYPRKDSTASDMVVNCKVVLPTLTAYGFSPTKSYDGCPANIPAHLRAHFMRGVFDGDGSIWSEKSQLRAYLCGNVRSIGWYMANSAGTDAFIVKQRPAKGGICIDGRPIADNGVAVTMQSRNSGDASTFLSWLYADKGPAYLPRKHTTFMEWQERAEVYAVTKCQACGEVFARRSSTDKFCTDCGIVRQRLYNRRSDNRRRNPTASYDVNAYRKAGEMHLRF